MEKSVSQIFYSVLLIYGNKFTAGLDDDTTDSRIIYLVSALSIAGIGYLVSRSQVGQIRVILTCRIIGKISAHNN